MMSRYFRVLGVRGSMKLQEPIRFIYSRTRSKQDAPLNPPREQYLVRIEDLPPNFPHVRTGIDSRGTDRSLNLLRAYLLLEVRRVEALETQKHRLRCSKPKGHRLVGDRQGGVVDDSRSLCVFDEGSDACLGTVKEHFVCARAEREESRQVLRHERLERASKGGNGSGQELSRSPRKAGAL